MLAIFKPQSKGQYLVVIAICILALTLALSVYSLFFGINPHDEAFYISLPYRFALGDVPFVNEYNIAQTAGLYLLPFIKIYLFIVGSTKGIVLFSRAIYFLLTGFIATVIFYIFKRISNFLFAVLIALVPVIFVPFNLHDLSYNTLSMLFLSVGFFTGFCATNKDFAKDSKASYRYVFLSGCCSGIAVVSYPPLVVMALLYLLLVGSQLSFKKTIFYFILGALLTGGWIFVYLFKAGWQQLLLDYHYEKSFGIQGGGIAKLELVLRQLLDFFPHKKLCLLLVIAEYILHRKFKAITFIVYALILSILLVDALSIKSYIASNILLTNLSWLGGFLFLRFNSNTITDRNIFIMIWIPSVLAGLLTAWNSSNVADNYVIGGLSAALISMYFILRACTAENIQNKNVLVVNLHFLLSVAVVFTLQYFNVFYTYEDANVTNLSYRMPSGPFAGIYTTEKAGIFYEALESDLNSIEKSHKSILFFDDFPAGYLFTALKPVTNTTWLISPFVFSGVDREATLSYYQGIGRYPEVVVKMLSIPSAAPNTFYEELPQDPINGIIKKYTRMISRKDYVIFTN